MLSIFFLHIPVVMTSLDPLEVSIVSLAQNVTIVEGDEVVLKCIVHRWGLISRLYGGEVSRL